MDFDLLTVFVVEVAYVYLLWVDQIFGSLLLCDFIDILT